jgi:hypothetical protein
VLNEEGTLAAGCVTPVGIPGIEDSKESCKRLAKIGRVLPAAAGNPLREAGAAPGAELTATVGVAFEMEVSAISSSLPAIEKACWRPKSSTEWSAKTF